MRESSPKMCAPGPAEAIAGRREARPPRFVGPRSGRAKLLLSRRWSRSSPGGLPSRSCKGVQLSLTAPASSRDERGVIGGGASQVDHRVYR